MNERQKRELESMVRALVPSDLYSAEITAAARELLIAAGTPGTERVAVAMVGWINVVNKAGLL